MTSESTAPEWSRFVSLEPLPSDPILLTATERECSALAERFDLMALNSLVVEVRFHSHSPQRYICKGKGVAHLIQASIVSLQEVPSVLEFSFETHLLPPSADPEDPALAEVDVELYAPSLQINMGELAAQSFYLSLDPYPRTSEEYV